MHAPWLANNFRMGPNSGFFRTDLLGPELPQFLTSNVRFHGNDHAAWVFVEENLLGSSLSAVAAVNVFMRVEGNWKMVGHQAAPLIPDLDISSGS